jgi:hypothetical protein
MLGNFQKNSRKNGLYFQSLRKYKKIEEYSNNTFPKKSDVFGK